jgi:flagellar hook-associated protein 2
MAGIDLSLSGLASGFDWKSFVDQMIQVERAPEQKLLSAQSVLNQKNAAYGDIKTQLEALQTKIQALKDVSLFDSRTSTPSDATLAAATATNGAALGSFNFNITQLATASRINGAANAGVPLNPTNDVSALTLSAANFPIAVTAGTLTVNGKQITVAATDTLQQVFDKIAAATNNEVTAAYDSSTDQITLTGTGEIILGTATDTSNFFQAARLVNNGTNIIASSQALGSVRLANTLASANFSTAISDGGAGAGEFKINGVSIAFNAGTDTVNDILGRINSSAAGVSASYDVINDRFILTSKATGDMGVALEDVTGNFLAASGLAGGTLTHGQNLIYTVDGSAPLISQSNTITEASSGIAGLSVTALKANSTVTVTVGSDTDKIKSAIKDFVDAYNKVQSLIDTQTASSTDAKGVVTAGLLAGEIDADQIASTLRRTVYTQVAGLTGTLSHLADLGIVSNGNDNTLSLSDTDQLDNALATNLQSVKQFFTDTTNGLAVSLDNFLTRTVSDDGSLASHQKNLTLQAKDIDQQIADMERLIADDKDRMTQSFIAMELAQQQMNQQMSFLAQRLASMNNGQ